MMRRANVILLGLLLPLMVNCSDVTVPSDVDKAEILRRYAPRLWFHTDEVYFPSSVEWAFPNLKRVRIGGDAYSPDGDPPFYSLVTKSPIVGDYFLLGPDYEEVYEHSFFFGSLESAVVYAFWVEKAAGDVLPVVDLVYFIYYPFNKGKSCGGVRYQSHVGDWEYLVVRIPNDDPDNPLQVAMSAHNFVDSLDWADADKVEDTHVVAHVAWGSHGMWKDEGAHLYDRIVCDLHDYTGKGSSWDTWHSMRMFDFTARAGIAGDVWPKWMGEDFSQPGGSNPYDPAAGAIYRWGNPEGFCGPACAAFVLTSGPTGPISKGVFYSRGFE